MKTYSNELIIDLQLALELPPQDLPSQAELVQWSSAALSVADYHKDAEITVRLVESQEVQQLNAEYRHLDKPTNILSFPFECPPQLELPLLGDLVICDKILRSEALEQHKSYQEHFAHLIIHGILHLLGFDHIEPRQAEEMESLEIAALKTLGYPDPYFLED